MNGSDKNKNKNKRRGNKSHSQERVRTQFTAYRYSVLHKNSHSLKLLVRSSRRRKTVKSNLRLSLPSLACVPFRSHALRGSFHGIVEFSPGIARPRRNHDSDQIWDSPTSRPRSRTRYPGTPDIYPDPGFGYPGTGYRYPLQNS